MVCRSCKRTTISPQDEHTGPTAKIKAQNQAMCDADPAVKCTAGGYLLGYERDVWPTDVRVTPGALPPSLSLSPSAVVLDDGRNLTFLLHDPDLKVWLVLVTYIVVHPAGCCATHLRPCSYLPTTVMRGAVRTHQRVDGAIQPAFCCAAWVLLVASAPLLMELDPEPSGLPVQEVNKLQQGMGGPTNQSQVLAWAARCVCHGTVMKFE
jgi:hypothetical protein